MAQITLEHGGEALVDDLKELIYLLNAPPNLHNFLFLCQARIPQILDLYEDIEDDLDGMVRLNIELLDGPKRWLEWYLEHDYLFSSDPLTSDMFYLIRRTDKNPLNGWGLGRYPLYAALFHKPESSDAFRGWGGLMLFMWMAQVAVLKKDDQQDKYFAYKGDKGFIEKPRNTYHSSHMLRLLCNEDYEGMMVELSEMESIWEGAKDMGKEDTRISDVLAYVSKANSDNWTRGNGGGKGNRRRRKNLPLGYIDLSDGIGIALYEGGLIEDESDGSSLEVIGNPFDEKTANEILNLDLDPVELQGGEQLTLAKSACETTNKNVMSHELGARGRQQQLRMQNQLLPWQSSQLALGEVTDLYLYLMRQCEGLTKESLSDEAKCQWYELTLMLLVMLTTGSTVERAKQVSILKEGVKRSTASIFIYRHSEEDIEEGSIEYEWGVKALEPIYARVGSFESSIRKEKKGSFYLPDILEVAPFLVRYRENAVSIAGKKRTVFQRDMEYYKKALKAYIQTIPEAISDRLTVNRISKYLFYQITAATNDVTAAACITAQEHHLAASRIHYTVLDIDYLRAVMKEALTPLLLNLGRSPDEMVIVKSKVPAYVGARHCLKMSAYQKAVKQVLAELRRHKRIKDMVAFIDYHNLYTAYTAWVFNFGITGRGINNPLIKSSDFDPSSGLSTYRDKDIEQPYHARLLWLPPEVKRQLLNYEEHLSVVMAILSLHCKADEMPAADTTGFFLHKSQKRDHIKPIPITGVNMRKHLYAKYLNAPHNSHRRFVRSELVERGHSAESIDALLGHWFNGEEPWSYFSSFDFGRHIELLKGSLVPLMKEIGFKSIGSVLLKGKI